MSLNLVEITLVEKVRKLRRYGLRKCLFCGNMIKRAGYAWVSHGRKHVREGIAEEIRGLRIVFKRVWKNEKSIS